MKPNPIHGALFGLAIGDALGVPAEFKSAEALWRDPIEDFVGYKSHNQPPGTFSDDSSLTFCLAESLCKGYDLYDIAAGFINWKDNAWWTAHNEVFDIGNTTHAAISRLKQGIRPDLAGDTHESANGNGSLMRILPLLFYIREFDIDKRYQLTKEVSSITHGHERSVIACFYYLEFARELLGGVDKYEAYNNTAKTVTQYCNTDLSVFAPLLTGDIARQPPEDIRSTGYVVHTLLSSVYCLLTTHDYKRAVLRAVNLGDDTDTTAAVTGGLAGLLYGYGAIPESWRKGIAGADDIEDLCNRFSKAMQL